MPTSAAYDKPWPLFWAASAAALVWLAASLVRRARGWARGGPSAPPPPAAPARVARIWVEETLVQRPLLRLSALRWAAHAAIAWGFAALALLSLAHVAAQALEALAPGGGFAAWLLRGGGQAAGKAWGNGAGLLLLGGLLLALARRLGRPRPAAGEPPEADLPLVLALLALTVSGFLLEWLRLAQAGAGPEQAAALRPWLTALWTAHGLGGVALVAWLPRSTLVHALLAPLVIALNARHEHPRRDLAWPPPPRPKATASRQG